MAEDQPRVIITGTGASASATNDVIFAKTGSGDAVMVDPISNELRAMGSQLLQVLERHDSAAAVLDLLKALYASETAPPREWELAGLYFYNRGRLHEALGVFQELYQHLLQAQEVANAWVHKGLPLCWICDCYQAMGYPVHAKRYLMLTLCEDAIRSKGAIVPEEGGIYFRAVWRHGISDQEFHQLAAEFYRLWSKSDGEGLFPEAPLQELSSSWQTEIPSALESGTYVVNPLYVNHLLQLLGDGTGLVLERLAQYLMGCMPGCRTMRRVKTPSTDLDLVCSVEGFEVDFRAELGRYFLCECKDWKKPADFSTVAKFCRVLDSVKARFGVLFSKNGATGEGRTKDSEREIFKYFQDSGKVIVVVSQADLEKVARGHSFLRMLRAKYEAVRLDLVTGGAGS